MPKRSLIIDFDLPSERTRIAQGIHKLRGKYRLEIKKYRKRRSDNQNAWYWGCVLPSIREGLHDAWGEAMTIDEVHEFCKARFLSKPIVNRKTGEVMGERPGSSAALDTSQFTEYVETLRKFAAEYLEIDIPDPT